jgi:Na+-transporting NADH:ubiquinone oxidoreductase subunit NqrF
MDIYLGILSFTLIVAFLVAFVMLARSQLVSTG